MAIIFPDFTPPPCEDCGMGTVHHGLERISLRVDAVTKVMLRPFDLLFAPFMPHIERAANAAAPYVAGAFFKTGLAVKVSDPDGHSWETAQALWHEAKRRGIDMYEVRLFGLPRRQFVAIYGGKSYWFEAIPHLPHPQPSLEWIDDKAELKRRFMRAGFPVAKGGSASSEHQALTLFRSLAQPVIVKPRLGSGGRHTTVDIMTEDELLRAYRTARLIAPSAIVEEQLVGPVFRATLIDRKLVAVLRRDPPQVVGDGRSTVRELVDAENRNPLRRGPVFALIDLSSVSARKALSTQELSPESIPEQGRTVVFHFKINWAVGGTSRDATPEVHPDNRKLFEDIGAYLGDDIIGIDFMIEDIGKSWRTTPRCGVIECNSLPLIGNHHFPYTGPVRDVAGAVWDMVFPETKKRR